MKKHVKAILLIMITITIIFSFTIKKDLLILQNIETNKVEYVLDISGDRTFSMRWTHSVELTPWEEYFEVNNENMIILIKTRFKSFGAGVPDSAGKKSSIEDGYVVYSDINQDMPSLAYGISPFAKHTLIHGNKEFKLYEFLPDDIGISFNLESVGIIKYLFYFLNKVVL